VVERIDFTPEQLAEALKGSQVSVDITAPPGKQDSACASGVLRDPDDLAARVWPLLASMAAVTRNVKLNSLTEAFEGYDALWDAVTARCEELIKAVPDSPGNSQGIAMLGADGRSVSRFARIWNRDGTKTVHHVTAYAPRLRTGPSLRVETWLDNCDEHWSRTLADDATEPDRVVIVRHVHYRYAPDLAARNRDLAGFAGRLFRIRFHDGREIETRNLWEGGTIPPAWRGRLPDNAIFLDMYGDPQQPLVKTTWADLQQGDLVYRPGKRITVRRASMTEEGVACKITVEGLDQNGEPAAETWLGGPAAYVSRPEQAVATAGPGDTADGYDPLPDLGALLVAALHWRQDTGAIAGRAAARLGLTADDTEDKARERLTEALSKLPPEPGTVQPACKCDISGPGTVIPAACPAHGVRCGSCGGLEECAPDCDGEPVDGEGSDLD
jgi:hypothetical protein